MKIPPQSTQDIKRTHSQRMLVTISLLWASFIHNYTCPLRKGKVACNLCNNFRLIEQLRGLKQRVKVLKQSVRAVISSQPGVQHQGCLIIRAASNVTACVTALLRWRLALMCPGTAGSCRVFFPVRRNRSIATTAVG